MCRCTSGSRGAGAAGTAWAVAEVDGWAELAAGSPAERASDAKSARARDITGADHVGVEPESFAPMAKVVGAERQSIVTDHLGVPIAMHDAVGEEVWSAQLGTWGDLRRMKVGDAQDCPFRWH